MRTAYDAVTASNIPRSAEIVCGYDDGLGKWSASDWALFPNAVQVHISSLGHNTGHVLDCEPGNPNAVQAVNWILQRRAAGVDPYVYTAEWAPGYRWVDVRAACDARGVTYPHWWKAPGHQSEVGTYDGTQPLMVQYSYPGPYDINSVADWLPGIEEAPQDTPEEPPKEVSMAKEVFVADEARQLLHYCYLQPGEAGAILWYRNGPLAGAVQSAPFQVGDALDDNAGLWATLGGSRLHVFCRAAAGPTTGRHFWSDDLKNWGWEAV